MKSKQIKNVVIVAALLTVSSFAISQERLNGREAVEVCKNEISDTYASEREIRFSRNTANSLKAGAYKFWMNATEDDNGVISSVRYQCEITRNGELVGLTREAGRWNI